MKPKRSFPDNRTALKFRDLRELMRAFEHYGGAKCACCSESEPAFLSLDHKNNDGVKQRLLMGGRRDWGGHHLARKLRILGYPDGYQVLCMNCNMGRRKNNGVCPHKSPTVPLKERLAQIEAMRGTKTVGNLFDET